MCVLAFSLGVLPDYPFVIVSNRDEFFNRKSVPTHYHGQKLQVLSGLEAEKGGTWLGITKTGRFAVITNYRDPSNVFDWAKSRGKLVLDFLHSDETVKEFIQSIESEFDEFNGYNLLLGELKELDFWYVSNVAKKAIKVESGIHAISNAFLNSPWPKAELLKRSLGKELEKPEFSMDDLEGLILNKQKFPLDDLPKTGVPPEIEEMLSSIFITSPAYGTVSSTIVVVDSKGKVDFRELVHTHDNSTFARSNFQFHLH